MIRTKVLLPVCFLMCCALPMVAQSVASADSVVPGIVRFTSNLRDTNGKPLTGTVGVSFLLYTEQSGGTPLWIETQNVSPDAQGHFTVQLGSTANNGLPVELFRSGEARWLSTRINGGEEQPRVLLVSVPYALKAADAQTLGGLPASAFMLAAPISGRTTSVEAGTSSATSATAPPPTSSTGTTDFLPLWLNSTGTLGNSVLFQSGTGSTAKVGVNTTVPGATLDVKGTATVRGLLTLPATANATSAAGANSQSENFIASAFNGGTHTVVNQKFRWQAEPVGNNTANASGSLNLLFAPGSGTPAETGLKIGSTGRIAFASGQTFPGTATSVGLSAPSSDFTVSGSPVTGAGTLALNWTVTPTSADNADAIVKRDSSGSFSAGDISSIGNVNASGNVTAIGNLSASNLLVTGIVAAGGNGALGVIGHATTQGNAGPTSGVVGDSASDNGHGVFGLATGTNGAGVWGEGVITGAAEDGVVGVANGPANGVVAVNTADGDGLFADSMFGFAGVFVGDVDVTGNLSKAGGSFKIDHPLDPANKYLYHSFVESPDMMNIYNGTVTTDAQGEAVVTLPEWFEALNRDFRYQLTCIGGFAPVYVAQKVQNNVFKIAGGTPAMEVSWQVTGVRHDAWADAHRIPLEQTKPDKERGLYLHPELFGVSAEKSIAAARHPEMKRIMKEVQPRRPIK
jgi:hypothetical protein